MTGKKAQYSISTGLLYRANLKDDPRCVAIDFGTLIIFSLYFVRFINTIELF
jgi:hypothetical protein